MADAARLSDAMQRVARALYVRDGLLGLPGHGVACQHGSEYIILRVGDVAAFISHVYHAAQAARGAEGVPPPSCLPYDTVDKVRDVMRAAEQLFATISRNDVVFADFGEPCATIYVCDIGKCTFATLRKQSFSLKENESGKFKTHVQNQHAGEHINGRAFTEDNEGRHLLTSRKTYVSKVKFERFFLARDAAAAAVVARDAAAVVAHDADAAARDAAAHDAAARDAAAPNAAAHDAARDAAAHDGHRGGLNAAAVRSVSLFHPCVRCRWFVMFIIVLVVRNVH